jgi:hypothetical protein
MTNSFSVRNAGQDCITPTQGLGGRTQGASQSTYKRQARALSGIEGADRMLVEYADLIDQLADLWRFPMLKLPARPESYEARTNALTKWAMVPSA